MPKGWQQSATALGQPISVAQRLIGYQREGPMKSRLERGAPVSALHGLRIFRYALVNFAFSWQETPPEEVAPIHPQAVWTGLSGQWMSF